MKIPRAVLLFLFCTALLGRTQDAAQKPPDAELLAQINKEYRAKNYATVTELCRDLIEKYPYHREVQAGHLQLKLIWSLHYQGLHDDAGREAKKFIDRFPEHAQIATAYYIQGTGYEQLGDAGGWHDKAREAYRKALETERAPSMIKIIKKRLADLNEQAQDSALKERELAQTDPARVVIVNDPLPSEEGHPPKANLGVYVILTDIAEDDPYYEAVERLSKLRKAKKVLHFVSGGLDDVALSLKDLGPEYVCVVAKPETIDRNLACQLLEMSTKLDSDPFPDFLFGFITGASAKDAVEFVKRLSKAEKRHAPLPRKILHLGKSGSSRVQTDVYEWATGFTTLGIYYEDHEFLRQHFDKIRGNGILVLYASSATPEGIENGLSADDLAAVDLSPAVVFSSADYTGITTKVIRPFSQSYKTGVKEISPDASFCLKVIGSGATAYFAPLGSTTSTLSSQEVATLLRTGLGLGHAIKHTHDGLILARAESTLQLPALLPGKPQPSATSLDRRVQSAATRVLYGDPACKPLAQGIGPAINVTARRRPNALRVVCERPEGEYDATFMDAFRSIHQEDTYRSYGHLRFAFELPRGFDKNIKSIKVQNPDKKLGELKPVFVTCMVEKWGGKKLAHFQMDLPPRTIRHEAFSFEISFVLEK